MDPPKPSPINLEKAKGIKFSGENEGAIGLRLTGVVARIVMDRWARLLKEALEKAEVPVHMLEKYVDDVNLVTSLIEPGYRWERILGQEVLNWKEERERKTREREVLPRRNPRENQRVVKWTDTGHCVHQRPS